MGQLEAEFRSVIRDEIAPLRDQMSSLLNELRARAACERLGPQAIAPANEYFTRRQAAEVMNYSVRTITRLMDAGKLRPCGPRRDRIARAELERFMAEAPGERGLSEEDVNEEADRLLGDDKE